MALSGRMIKQSGRSIKKRRGSIPASNRQLKGCGAIKKYERAIIPHPVKTGQKSA
jgi:hypothetical protein